jgi:phosphoglucomutase
VGTRISPLAGQQARIADLVDASRLVDAYYRLQPDPSVPAQRVAFGTSGHRGSSFERTFNERHVVAITQAICEQRKRAGVDGPLFIGIDTHALSVPAFENAMEVLAANDVDVMIAQDGEFTPTPAISHAILAYNRGRQRGLVDGIVMTPSHNPPDNGGFKYNPANGGPADTGVTGWIEARANALLDRGLAHAKRVPFGQARRAARTREHDFLTAYVDDLASVIDLDAIRGSGIRMGVDPLGGAGVHYWARIAERYKIDLSVISEVVDPTFRFMTLDWDGRIRMDPSSVHAMKRLVTVKDRYDIAFACDTDHDRHGIVTPRDGLLPANHYLAVAIEYLYTHRPRWNPQAAVGKTVVSSAIIDRVTKRLNRELYEVPVGFKWFVDRLLDGSVGFAGEESAGAACRRSCPPKSWRVLAEIRARFTEASRASLANRPPIASKRRPAPCKSRGSRNSQPGRFTAPSWAENRSTTCSIALRGTTRRSAASRSSARTAGSRHVPRAPRTSTRSTRKASAANANCERSWPRRKRSSMLLSQRRLDR